MELTKAQKLALEVLAKSPLNEKFYWTGGTLLSSYYLHHRKSLDIDLFSEKPFAFEEINEFIQVLKEKGGFKKAEYQKIFDRFEFLLQNNETLRIEFVYYNHEKKTLNKREKLLGVYIDSLEDVAANKIMAYFDRNEPKDLFDIYFLLTQKNILPETLLDLVSKKFGLEFSESLFWSESFKVFPLLHELKPFILEETHKETLLKEIEAYFKEKSSEFLKKHLL